MGYYVRITESRAYVPYERLAALRAELEAFQGAGHGISKVISFDGTEGVTEEDPDMSTVAAALDAFAIEAKFDPAGNLIGLEKDSKWLDDDGVLAIVARQAAPGFSVSYEDEEGQGFQFWWDAGELKSRDILPPPEPESQQVATDRYTDRFGTSFAGDDRVRMPHGMTVPKSIRGVETALWETAHRNGVELENMVVDEGWFSRSFSYILVGKMRDVHSFGRDLQAAFEYNRDRY